MAPKKESVSIKELADRLKSRSINIIRLKFRIVLLIFAVLVLITLFCLAGHFFSTPTIEEFKAIVDVSRLSPQESLELFQRFKDQHTESWISVYKLIMDKIGTFATLIVVYLFGKGIG